MRTEPVASTSGVQRDQAVGEGAVEIRIRPGQKRVAGVDRHRVVEEALLVHAVGRERGRPRRAGQAEVRAHDRHARSTLGQIDAEKEHVGIAEAPPVVARLRALGPRLAVEHQRILGVERPGRAARALDHLDRHRHAHERRHLPAREFAAGERELRHRDPCREALRGELGIGHAPHAGGVDAHGPLVGRVVDRARRLAPRALEPVGAATEPAPHRYRRRGAERAGGVVVDQRAAIEAFPAIVGERPGRRARALQRGLRAEAGRRLRARPAQRHEVDAHDRARHHANVALRRIDLKRLDTDRHHALVAPRANLPEFGGLRRPGPAPVVVRRVAVEAPGRAQVLAVGAKPVLAEGLEFPSVQLRQVDHRLLEHAQGRHGPGRHPEQRGLGRQERPTLDRDVRLEPGRTDPPECSLGQLDGRNLMVRHGKPERDALRVRGHDLERGGSPGGPGGKHNGRERERGGGGESESSAVECGHAGLRLGWRWGTAWPRPLRPGPGPDSYPNRRPQVLLNRGLWPRAEHAIMFRTTRPGRSFAI